MFARYVVPFVIVEERAGKQHDAFRRFDAFEEPEPVDYGSRAKHLRVWF